MWNRLLISLAMLLLLMSLMSASHTIEETAACTDINIVNLSTSEQHQIPSEYVSAFKNVAKGKKIKPTSQDYEVAKVEYLCKSQIPYSVYVYFSPIYGKHFVSLESGNHASYHELDKSTEAVLSSLLGNQ